MATLRLLATLLVLVGARQTWRARPFSEHNDCASINCAAVAAAAVPATRRAAPGV